MARTSSPGVHVRPTLLVAAGVALVFARIWGPAGEDATRLSFVILLAATLGNLLAAIVVVHKTSTRIVDNPTDAVVGEPAGVEVSISGMRTSVSVRMRSSPDAPWVTAVPPDTGLLPGNAYFRGVASRVEVEVCSWGPLGLIGYSRTRLLDLRRTLWIGPRPVRVEGAHRPPAAHGPAAGRSGGGRRRGRHHPERARVRARRSPAPRRLVGHRTHRQARDRASSSGQRRTSCTSWSISVRIRAKLRNAWRGSPRGSAARFSGAERSSH